MIRTGLLSLLTTGLVRALDRAVRPLDYRGALRLGRCLGRIWYHGVPVRTNTVHGAIEATFARWPVHRVRSVAEAVLQNVASNVTTLLWATARTEHVRVLERIVRFDGWDHLERARDTGAVVACSHTGNWDLVALAAAQRGLSLTVLTRNLKNFALDRLWNLRRNRGGLRILDQASPLEHVLDSVGPGRTLALMMDQRTPRRQGGTLLDFLFRPAWTTTLPAVTALRRQVPLLAVNSLVDADGTLRVWIRPVHPRMAASPPSRRIRLICRDLNEILELHVLRHPESWLWLHRRWLPEPTDEAGDAPSRNQRVQEKDLQEH